MRDGSSDTMSPINRKPNQPAIDALKLEPDISTLELGFGPAANATVPQSSAIQMPHIELTVIVPTFEERVNVPILVDRLAAALDGIEWEVIFVDDDSHDDTASLVRQIGRSNPRVRCVRRIGRRGLAGACIEGMLAAQGDSIAIMDADLQHDETLLPVMLDALRRDKSDIVIGSRYIPSASAGGFSKNRKRGSWLANRLTQQLLGLNVSDPMSGFFMLRRETANKIAPQLSNQGFKLLMDILISSHGSLRVTELPYSFRTRLHGASKLDSQVVIEFAGLLLARATGNLVPIRFFQFSLVGASGLIVHLLVLRLALFSIGLDFIYAQTGATFAAMTSNFLLNNIFTYSDRRLTGMAAVRGLMWFYAVCAVGALSNLGIANWIYANRPVWLLAGLAGSLVGAVWNFVMSTEIVWKLGPAWPRRNGN
jgi:dolichol-phosphate mannosyltransferase